MKVLVISFSFEQEPEALQVLEDAGLEVEIWKEQDRKGATEQDLISRWKAMEVKPDGILIGADLPITAEVVAQCEGLKAISLNCAGYDHLDREALDKAGVRYCNVPRQNFSAVADLAWGLLIGVMRKIPFAERNLRAGNWVDGVARGISVSGKTLGIIGFGAIGKAVAKRAQGFDMEVLVHTRTLHEGDEEKHHMKYVSKDELFARSDVIVLCCGVNEGTYHIIDEEALKKMKQTAFLVNPSRGALIDTDALIKALDAKEIAGAALDAYEEEPLLNSPLFARNDVVLTPHIGGLADREIHNVAMQSAYHMAELLKDPDSDLKIV